ncbi:very short patch repair endonuclease [Geomonas oryzae]|uniref:very short patch repair endonuclease n=1 Tax=Geomonas oryzae TaxID=2364273 RepID=UPI00100AF53F|nr:very short patch repair endonuclease [Geomonas oryzae]
MSDVFNKEKRSWIMSRIRGGNTKPEITVRKLLHGMGFRFRLHVKTLPGKPDIVLPRYRKVILVHGCFWHGHQDCPRSKRPATNAEFWNDKITANMERDRRNKSALEDAGWQVLELWTCELKDTERLSERLKCFLLSDGFTGGA